MCSHIEWEGMLEGVKDKMIGYAGNEGEHVQARESSNIESQSIIKWSCSRFELLA